MRTRERFSALASMRPLNKEMITPRQRGGKPKTPHFLLLFEKIQTKQPLGVATVVTDKKRGKLQTVTLFSRAICQPSGKNQLSDYPKAEHHQKKRCQE